VEYVAFPYCITYWVGAHNLTLWRVCRWHATCLHPASYSHNLSHTHEIITFADRLLFNFTRVIFSYSRSRPPTRLEGRSYLDHTRGPDQRRQSQNHGIPKLETCSPSRDKSIAVNLLYLVFFLFLIINLAIKKISSDRYWAMKCNHPPPSVRHPIPSHPMEGRKRPWNGGAASAQSGAIAVNGETDARTIETGSHPWK